MDEVTRNLIPKRELAPKEPRRREAGLRRHCPKSAIKRFQPLIDTMTNDSGNRRHFPVASLQPWEIDAPGPFAGKLHEQTAAIEAPLPPPPHGRTRNVTAHHRNASQ